MVSKMNGDITFERAMKQAEFQGRVLTELKDIRFDVKDICIHNNAQDDRIISCEKEISKMKGWTASIAAFIGVFAGWLGRFIK